MSGFWIKYTFFFETVFHVVQVSLKLTACLEPHSRLASIYLLLESQVFTITCSLKYKAERLKIILSQVTVCTKILGFTEALDVNRNHGKSSGSLGHWCLM